MSKIFITPEDFFETITEDACINATGVCLYLAMLHTWKQNGCPESLEVDRNQLMHLCKIRARATYDKCLHTLHELRYINYSPVRGCKKSKVAFRRL